MVRVEGLGEVTVDISYGGAFYAFVNAQRFGLDVTKSKTGELANVATALTNAVRSQVIFLSTLCSKYRHRTRKEPLYQIYSYVINFYYELYAFEFFKGRYTKQEKYSSLSNTQWKSAAAYLSTS